MKIIKGIAKLYPPIYDRILRLGTLVLKNIGKRTPFNVIHDDVKSAMVVNQIDNPGNGRMVKAFDHVSFNGDALDEHVAFDRIRHLLDLFDGPLFIQRSIERKIDGGHSALAYLRQYTISSPDYRILSNHFSPQISQSDYPQSKMRKAQIAAWQGKASGTAGRTVVTEQKQLYSSDHYDICQNSEDMQHQKCLEGHNESNSDSYARLHVDDAQYIDKLREPRKEALLLVRSGDCTQLIRETCTCQRAVTALLQNQAQ